jgi:putative selenate reductase molybdopterin-binding subunit
MGNGSVTSHRQIAAGVLGSRADQIEIINADTDLTPYDTGTFASTGTVVAGQAVALTAAALRDNILGSLRSRPRPRHRNGGSKATASSEGTNA